MHKIRIIAVVFGLALGVAGCSENKAVKVATEAADAVCKCETAKCARAKFAEGSQKVLEVLKDAKGSEDDAKKVVAQQKRARTCMRKLVAAKAKGGRQ